MHALDRSIGENDGYIHQFSQCTYNAISIVYAINPSYHIGITLYSIVRVTSLVLLVCRKLAPEFTPAVPNCVCVGRWRTVKQNTYATSDVQTLSCLNGWRVVYLYLRKWERDCKIVQRTPPRSLQIFVL